MRHFITRLLAIVVLCSCLIITPNKAWAYADILDNLALAAQENIKKRGSEGAASIGALVGGTIGFLLPFPGTTLWGAGIGLTIGSFFGEEKDKGSTP